MTDTTREQIHQVATRAKEASRILRTLTGSDRLRGLEAMARALEASAGEIAQANAADVASARAAGMSPGLIDRLFLDEDRVGALASAVRDVASLPDPVGSIAEGRRLPNGLEVSRVRVPLGVIGMIYEARPNVTVDAAALAWRCGNAVVLRGGSAAQKTNAILVATLRRALRGEGLPEDAIATIDEWGREGAGELMRLRGVVDVIIPRGGAGLIEATVTTSLVPVIETGTGNCHVYVDASADLDMARDIVLNAKTQRVGVCNACETVLVDSAGGREAWAQVANALRDAGVRLHVGPQAVAAYGLAAGDVAGDEEDFSREYLSMECALEVVDGVEGALAHIDRYTSGHTEAIVASAVAVIERFCAGVDAAAVAVNASTRFTDGAQLGLGAEIGISTQKLHARGPMGLEALTTTTWRIVGSGQVRG